MARTASRIDHVQGDPFATPSRVRIVYKNEIPVKFFDRPYRRTATEDALLRRLHGNLFRASKGGGRRGSGKSGLITACRTGQEVLQRSAMQVTPKEIEARIEVGFPAYGRTIAAQELEELLFDVLPEVAEQTFRMQPRLAKELESAVDLADDQQFIRQELKTQGLAAFVADGAVLPRESGVSQKKMSDAVPFQSPDSLAVTLELPHHGALRGMGIRNGITVITGGGFHGKSTLLKALERGVYNHIAGDGREYVITDASAFKLRAEEGRSIHGVDISTFISNLPTRADTANFSTENASGSTSQAANTVEALSVGSKVLLIDEDTLCDEFYGTRYADGTASPGCKGTDFTVYPENPQPAQRPWHLNGSGRGKLRRLFICGGYRFADGLLSCTGCDRKSTVTGAAAYGG